MTVFYYTFILYFSIFNTTGISHLQVRQLDDVNNEKLVHIPILFIICVSHTES